MFCLVVKVFKCWVFFFQAEDGIRDADVTGVQTCALPIWLFAAYSDVQFRAPVLAGDVIEVTATVARVGRRSREIAFEARVTCRADPGRGPSAGRVLDEPLVVVTAVGTVVAPAP